MNINPSSIIVNTNKLMSLFQVSLDYISLNLNCMHLWITDECAAETGKVH